MKIVSKKENQMVFRTEIDESLANAIRRYVYQIPVLAIDEVEISKNDSALYDETIAHRLGLVPLEMKGAAKKEATLKLNVDKEGLVYSGNLKGDVKVVYDKIPITSLNKGQELEIVATARLGKGSEHAKFSPGIMVYRNMAEIKIEKECPAEITEICPKRILKSENGKISVTDSLMCDLCNACVEFSKKKKKEFIKVTPTEELLISVESFGQLETGDIFKKAVEELKRDLHEVEKHVSKA